MRRISNVWQRMNTIRFKGGVKEVTVKKGLVLSLMFATVLSSFPARAIDGPEVIRNQQNRYDKLRSLSGRFKKKHYWKLVDRATEIKGRLYVQKPDRFRFETDVQTVVTDGATAWNYVPENEQVLLSTYERVHEDQSYEKLLFDLILLGGYEGEYRPKLDGEVRVDRKRCYLVVLTAKEEDRYIARVRLWVDRKLWLVRRVEYLNLNDDVTTYELTDLKVDKKLDPSLFGFTPPDDVEVIDMR